MDELDTIVESGWGSANRSRLVWTVGLLSQLAW